MSTTPTTPHVDDIHETRQPGLYAAVIAGFILSTIAVGLRFLTRKVVQQGYWLDDWFILVAWFIGVGIIVNYMYWVEQGFGLHMQVLGDDYAYYFFQRMFIGEIFYIWVICFAKFSILSFYWLLFSVRSSIKIPIWILASTVTLWGITLTLVTIFQCVPVAGLWDKTLPNIQCKVQVVPFFYGNSVPNILTDIALLILPIPYIWRLQRKTYEKISITSAFLLGGFECIISIVRFVKVVQADGNSPDVDWNLAMIGIWTAAECYIGIVCACLPSLKGLVSFAINGGRKKKSAMSEGNPTEATSENCTANAHSKKIFPVVETDETSSSSGSLENGRSEVEGLEKA